MNADDARRLLLVRRELTGETFHDGTIEAWADALRDVDPVHARQAMNAAAVTTQRVTVAQLVAQLPKPEQRDEAPPAYCQRCDGTGLIEAPLLLAHNPRTCRPDEDTPCVCHAFMACACTIGQQRAPMLRKVVESNAREIGHLLPPRVVEPEPARELF